MTGRRFTQAVKAETAARKPETVDTFGRLQTGDLFKATGRTGTYRFLSLTLKDGVDEVINALGPLGPRQNLKSIRPETVKMPSQKVLDRQRAS